MNIQFDSIKCEVKFTLKDNSVMTCWYDNNSKLCKSFLKNTEGKKTEIFTWGNNFRTHLLNNSIYFEDEKEQRFFEKFIINIDSLLGIF